MSLAGLIAESVRIARAQLMSTVITGVIVAGAVIAVLVTTGQTVLAESQVLNQIDAVGTRHIVITDGRQQAGIPASAVNRIAQLTQVDWVVGVGYAIDMKASAVGQGATPIPIRTIFGGLPATIRGPADPPTINEVLLSRKAVSDSGLRYGIGSLDRGLNQFDAVGTFEAKEPLSLLNDGGLIVASPTTSEPVARIHVVAARSEEVDQTAMAVLEVLGAQDPSQLTVETSRTLAQVRAAVAGELGRYSRRLVLGVLSGVLVLNGLVVYTMVTLQRQDFGRRRALGATRGTTVALVITQYALTATAGATIGCLLGTLGLRLATGEVPDAGFVLATAILAVLATSLAALPPALVASLRDPVKALRVP